jgi:hypothetical protein
MTEKWKHIDSDGEYEVSNYGRLRKVISGSYASGGYKKYQITQDGIKSRKFGHRLVAQYFLNSGIELERDEIVDHINGVRDDNRVENLRIVNYDINSENIKPVRDAIKRDLIKKVREYLPDDFDIDSI